MKKLALIASMIFSLTSAFAQKPKAENKTAEVNLNFQTGAEAINYDLPAELRLRYFISDNSAIRIRFGMAASTSKSSVTNGSITADITDKTGLGLTLTPGYEKHFKGTNKLSPFVGAQMGISIGAKNSFEVTNANVSTPKPGDIAKDDHYKYTSGNTLGLGLGLLMGADYYFTDGIYLGTEFGLNLFSYHKTGEGKTIVKTDVDIVTTKATESSSTKLFGVNTGGVRLGFVF